MTKLNSNATPQQWRRLIREGGYDAPTSGLCGGFLQCNLVILPQDAAEEFEAFCLANPKPCPLLAKSPTPGDPSLPSLGEGIDVRSDLPRYRHWQAGKVVGELASIKHLWKDNDVAFALGCSFSFDHALEKAGIDVRHVSEGCNVPMYRTSITCEKAGRFWGDMVVSMRPMMAKDAIRAIEISTHYPEAHGAPVHLGDPTLIGIQDLTRPDFGSAVKIMPGEIPVFWACGVTPQIVLENAQLPVAFTHAPGHMLITDKTHEDLYEIG